MKARQRYRILILFSALAVGVLYCLPIVVAGIEVSYRKHALESLRKQQLVPDGTGFLLDDTLDVADKHRKRLVELGAMVKVTYRAADELSRNEVLSLINRLETEFADTYWEVIDNRDLVVWEYPENKHKWDAFAQYIQFTEEL